MESAGVSTAGGNSRWTLHTIGSMGEELNDHSVRGMVKLLWVLFLIPCVRWFKKKKAKMYCCFISAVRAQYDFKNPRARTQTNTLVLFCAELTSGLGSGS